jgi:hypothetical protein
MGSVHGSGVTVWLRYPSSALQLDSVLRKVKEGLSTVGGPVSRAVAVAVLALIAETKGLASHVDHANNLIREVRRGSFLFNFVTPGLAGNVDIRSDYGPVKVEPFEPTRLEYWARRGPARWPVELNDLRGHVAAVGRVDDVTLINTDKLPGAERLFRKQADIAKGEALVDAYYQSVAEVLLENVAANMTQRLGLVEAAGIVGFDLASFSKWSHGIHLFTWTGSPAGGAGCWAISRQPGFMINAAPAEIWKDAREWMLKEFGIESLAGSDRPIDVAAQTFAGLMQAARAHETGGRLREAFLFLVIALDHLLGEDGKNVSTVADRTSVLTHRRRAKSFDSEVACVRRVYDTRSRLVHSGSPVTVDDLLEADAIACAVLWAMIRVVADGGLDERDDWVERIDALVHLFRGDPDVVTPERLAVVGCLSNFESGPPPPMLYREGVWE